MEFINEQMSKDIVDKFERGFEQDEFEMLFLTVKTVSGALQLGDNVLQPSLSFVASVDLRTNTFTKEKGRLEWLIPVIKDKPGWGYDFRRMNIYHIRCRKSFAPPVDKYFGQCYMVCEQINDGATDPRLEKLKAKLSKPVYIDDPEIGHLELNMEYSCFEGNIDWLGQACPVSLDTDRDGGKTAKNALAHLKIVYSNKEEWDKKFRDYAVGQLIDTISCQVIEGPEITAEKLHQIIHISSLSIDPGGMITVYYSDNEDVLCGHAIEIMATTGGVFVKADLVG